jgi:DNA helicase-2/ATP-dependent DNA helicase PcrA
MKITPEQSSIITSDLPNLSVVAAPGSGKTFVLVARVRHLIQTGTRPAKIVVITFTRSGAKEFRERLGLDAALGHCGTLHSLGMKILQGAGGIRTVIDETQAKRLLVECMKSLRIKLPITKLWRYARKQGFEDEDYTSNYELVLDEYRRLKNAHQMLTYDEVISEAWCHFNMEDEYPFDHVLVDEAQDCNQSDWDMIGMLAPISFAIGDPDQSLFGFRGAQPNLMMLGRQTMQLTGCFRCARVICEAANRLIERNGHKRNLRASMSAVRDVDGELIIWRNVPDPNAEALAIKAAIDRNAKCKSIAVLARTNAIVNDTTERLRAAGVKVLETRRIKSDGDIVRLKLFASFCADPENDILARWWLTETLGKEEADKVSKAAAIAMETINQHTLHIPKWFSVGQFLDHYKLHELKLLFGTNGTLLLHLAIQRIGAYASMADLAAALDEPEVSTVEVGEGIDCMTIHAAKGREWDVVFIVGMEDGTLPSKQASLEEERRLLYVAITRARDTVILSRCVQRDVNAWDKGEVKAPSMFLDELGV